MIFSGIFSLALLGTLAVALPRDSVARQSFGEVTFSLINDRTGANAPATVPVDSNKRWFINLFAGSPLVSDTRILGSSVQLVAFPQQFRCEIYTLDLELAGVLTEIITYIDLNNPTDPGPVDVTGYTITCYVVSNREEP
ncbi:hypothetical protein EYB26_007559 [Talaromyces marneffei]|uniref:Uncharacterized protein n=1 Tax=Talaromyces marneffei PM1 TaxID=1077442 RepID=A0A093UV56_TALMA|nr:uncharacterized protein EYB26_007559 [Talaromyces marneffei]QGA19864.1 hypothetical protein EYB26_007559 [Talaromyces marneffei]